MTASGKGRSRHSIARTAGRLPAILVFLTAVAGSAPVAPWQRRALACPAMAWPLAEPAVVAEYRGKLLESRAGGGVPGRAIGGGCGCTQ